jgi:hypothetical protein
MVSLLVLTVLLDRQAGNGISESGRSIAYITQECSSIAGFIEGLRRRPERVISKADGTAVPAAEPVGAAAGGDGRSSD